MRHFLATLTLVLGGLATGLAAQVYPEPRSTTVNDYAETIDAATEASLATRLAAIEAETGVQMTVVTLTANRYYGGKAAIETYADALFDRWGVGNAETNDGVMILLFEDDDDIRIQLGAGFDAAVNSAAQAVIDSDMLPLYRTGDHQGALVAGVEGMMARIITPRQQAIAAATPASSGAEGGGGVSMWWFLGPVVAVVAGLIGLNRLQAARNARAPCPKCGKTGLIRERVTLQEATPTMQGRGEARTTCPSCHNVVAVPFIIPLLSTDPGTDSSAKGSAGGHGGSGFGGGSSAGGGATGRE